MTPKPKRRRRRKWIILLIFIAAAGAYFGPQFFKKEDDTIPVQTQKVTRRDLTETVVASGRIQPVTQVVISPEVAGEIIELPVVEGQSVKKGDLLVQIKPDNYLAAKNSADASYKAALGTRALAEAELAKAEADFARNDELYRNKLIAENLHSDSSTALAVAKLRVQNATNNAEQARFALARAEDDLAKTKILAPIDGTVVTLNSQLGERVLGTSFNMGTVMMVIAQLDQMEARIDIGEIDIVLIALDQTVHLEVDAYKDRKFAGKVSAIANATKATANPLAQSGGNNAQEAPKFEVRIAIVDKESFRPGMSVTAEIETRSRKGVLTVPIQSVTTRLPAKLHGVADDTAKKGKPAEPLKPQEVVFAIDGGLAKMIPVKTGISDSDYFEITDGLTEGQEIITGGYKAISKDLADGKRVRIGADKPSK